MDMQILSPLELSITYICDCGNEKRTRTSNWLDDLIQKGETGKIPPLVAIRDSETQKLMIYDGNTRALHALQHGYDIPVQIIKDKEDLSTYFSTMPVLWFGIRDFQELLEYMRIYGRYPYCKAQMPKELKEKISEKYKKYRLHLEYQQKREIFGSPDDDD
ncbi:MAG: hypothetical protein V1743_00295 [Nanoarchaeota archaeon]